MSNKLIDKNRTINELSDSERKFSEIFINSPFGIVCFSKLGKIVDVNPAFCKIVDMPREEFVGKAVISLIKNRLSVKDIPIMLNRLKTLLLGKLVEPYELEFNGKIVEFHPP
ncbi:MAG: PAS domain S-box protein, partial [Candidatus Cloacimonetes bacterium]|nr:PAS domain S-box protein [Candidatus Cloacimonadota bacterium]